VTDIHVKLLAPDTEFSATFVQGMANRMTVSYFKYGAVADGYPTHVDAVSSLTQRLDEYRRTGNTEFLIDAANFAMIEFMHPAVPGAEFHGTDSDQSPGRTTANGAVTDADNKDLAK
jgi:hypothetical protein